MDVDLVNAVDAAVRERGGVEHGDEVRFRCPEPTQHAHGDRDPSADWNRTKGTWVCRVCSASGGVVDLATRLGVDRRTPTDLEGFATARGLPMSVLRAFGVRAVLRGDRAALVYPTIAGERVKFLDGRKPKYRWARRGGAPVRYGWDEAMALPGPLYIVNGEPSVWACHAAKVSAICFCAGEGAVPSAHLLRALLDMGRPLRVVYDTDDAGKHGAARIVAALREQGHADVAALDLSTTLPGVSGGDVGDLYRKVGSALPTTLADLPRLADDVDGTRDGVHLVPADRITPEAVRWAWVGRIPLGAVTLLVGDPGLGKSTLTIEIAARLSQGQLDGDLKGEPAVVALATAEDALAHVVRPRLDAAGADLARVHLVTVCRDGVTGGLVLPEDVDDLADRLRAVGARMLVVDPLVAHLPGAIDAHKDQHVRQALAPLGRLAERLGLAVVCVVHLNKGHDAAVIARVSGSVGFVAAARSVLLLGSDPDDREGSTRVVLHGKSNLSPLAPALRVRVEGRTIVVGDRHVETSAIAWCGEARGVSVADVLRTGRPGAGNEGRRGEGRAHGSTAGRSGRRRRCRARARRSGHWRGDVAQGEGRAAHRDAETQHGGRVALATARR